MLKMIDNTYSIGRIEYRPKYSVICEIGNTPFHGELVIIYSPREKLLEFCSFEEWLLSISLAHFTIESFCKRVFDTLESSLECDNLSVEVKAETVVHGSVSCSISKGEK